MANLLGISKGETLLWLRSQGYCVPLTLCVTVERWRREPAGVVANIHACFADCPSESAVVAVRSSSRHEDTVEFSRAGAFHSVLDVRIHDANALALAMDVVAASLDAEDDQIIIQSMVTGVVMSGVIMTRHLDDGSPYYVVNYDDTSGRTDTITSGAGIHKTVYVYRGVSGRDFDSPRLRAVIELAQNLEGAYEGNPLDIEFAMDAGQCVHLLQVRPIAASRYWRDGVAEGIDNRIGFVEAFVSEVMRPRDGLYGRRTILGVMPDWNPAEMIGISPRPLALSLYRRLITRRAWSLAREEMGYNALPPAELMLSIGGRPYIDVRASFNSFLPSGLDAPICERLVDAWLDRLDANPNLHDKIEFEIVHTVNEPDMEESFYDRYGDVLNRDEFAAYRAALGILTNRALRPGGSLDRALDTVRRLEAEQMIEAKGSGIRENTSPFDLALRIGTLLEQCLIFGTIPFSIIARHGFIAETFLRAAVRTGALAPERVACFKSGVQTVSGEISRDFSRVLSGSMGMEDFLYRYGHLRPGTYDILSPTYRERDDLFAGAVPTSPAGGEIGPFKLSGNESAALASLFKAAGIDMGSEAFFDYAAKAIAGREYGKFVFSRSVSRALDLLVEWGKHFSLSREDLSMLPIHEVTDALFTPCRIDGESHFGQIIRASREEYDLMRSFKMAYLLRSVRDIYIVPQHRSAPNFITSKRLRAPVAHLGGVGNSLPPLEGRIVCIESADPGYDWIFTRGVVGLITRYGGANSHMAIRCAEYGLPAAIGCGDLLFDQISKALSCLIDCAEKTVTPLGGGPSP